MAVLKDQSSYTQLFEKLESIFHFFFSLFSRNSIPHLQFQDFSLGLSYFEINLYRIVFNWVLGNVRLVVQQCNLVDVKIFSSDVHHDWSVHPDISLEVLLNDKQF